MCGVLMRHDNLCEPKDCADIWLLATTVDHFPSLPLPLTKNTVMYTDIVKAIPMMHAVPSDTQCEVQASTCVGVSEWSINECKWFVLSVNPCK